MHEVQHLPGTANGDLPLDHLEQTVRTLIETATELREREDAIRAELDRVREQRQRIDKAVNALTAPKPEPKPKGKPGPKPSATVGTPHPIRNAMSGYPGVSEEKQDEVLALLKTFDHPVSPREIMNHPDLRTSKATVQNALAHLRARGLVRWAGKGQGGGHKYAAFESGDEDAS